MLILVRISSSVFAVELRRSLSRFNADPDILSINMDCDADIRSLERDSSCVLSPSGHGFQSWSTLNPDKTNLLMCNASLLL